MKKQFLIFVTIIPFLLFSQTPDKISFDTGIDLYWLGVGYNSYDGDVAEELGFKKSTMAIEFRLGGFFKKYFIAGGSATLAFPKDLKPFSNTVTGGNRFESSVTIPQMALYSGLRMKPIIRANKMITGMVLVGNDWFVNARRGIDSCTDCTKHEFDISSGLFIQPEIDYGFYLGDDFPAEVGFSLGYKHFFAGDIKNSIILSTYFRRFN